MIFKFKGDDFSSICEYKYICLFLRTKLRIFRFYEEDSSNLDAFFKKFNLKNQPELLTEIDDYFGEDCSICDQRIRVTSLECAHKFCYNCWNSYLEEQVKSHALPYVTCPQYKCNIVLSDEVARELMEKDATVKAYDNLIIRSFVEVWFFKTMIYQNWFCMLKLIENRVLNRILSTKMRKFV